VLTFSSIFLKIENVKAQNSEYSIESVDHTLEIMYNGYVFINDTIKITGQIVNGFLLGFPYKYGSQILLCQAYNETHVFPITMDVPLENHVGFYGIRIDFPNGSPNIFSVSFILSNDLITQYSNLNIYTLDFPAYPSLTKTVTICNSSIVLSDAEYISGTINNFTYSKENLSAFTYMPANITFASNNNELQLFDIKEFKRDVTINGIGEISVSDSYYITSKAPNAISFLNIFLPQGSSEITTYDQLSRKMNDPVLKDDQTNRYEIALSMLLESHSSIKFILSFKLPYNDYITKVDTALFGFTLSNFENINYFINQSSFTIFFPEGAKIKNSNSIKESYDIIHGVFQEKLTLRNSAISPLDTVPVEVMYEYALLWVAFRPTLWVWVLVTIVSIIGILWKKSVTQITVSEPVERIKLDPKQISFFIDSYLEKKDTLIELKALETRMRKRKLSRRRYKVRKKILETRLKTLSRTITASRQKLQNFGSNFVDLMNQLEVSETEISEIDTNIASIETRHRRGDLSLEAYRKLLLDFERRKEEAETEINGILLRLREKIN
jgi:hypothetical protein